MGSAHHSQVNLRTPDYVRLRRGEVQIPLMINTKKNEEHPNGYSSLLVAERGFEPPDLRVMSPTSYQAALLRDIYLPHLVSA